MRLLFLDSETNGLPTNRYAPFTATECWPRLVSLSWQVVDTDSWTCLESRDYYVKTDAPWNADAERIHRIPESLIARSGRSPSEVLADLAVSIRDVDKIVCHNRAFDKSVVMAEAQRLYTAGVGVRPNTIWSKPDFCTMVATKGFCQLPFNRDNSSTDLKFPKLEELYKCIFGVAYDPSGADLHCATNDVACLVTCTRELVARGLVPGLVV